MILICSHCRKDWPLAGKPAGEKWVCTCGENLVSPPLKPFHAPVWHCGACGAGLAVGSKKCHYCDTGFRALDGKAFCARCMAYLETEAQYCSHCGSHAGDASLIPDESEHSCPRCSEPVKLVGIPVGLHHGEACPICEGVWLSQKAFTHVVTDFSAPEKQRPKDGGIQKPIPISHLGSKTFESVVKYLKCPECSMAMARRNYMRISGVILDICHEHGVWLDRDELRHVAKFLQEGGTARAQNVEKNEEMLKAKHQGDLRRMELNTSRSGAAQVSWPSGINDSPSLEVSRVVRWLLDVIF